MVTSNSQSHGTEINEMRSDARKREQLRKTANRLNQIERERLKSKSTKTKINKTN